MAVKREWTEYEKQSLLKHVSYSKKTGVSMKHAAHEFS